MRAAPPNDRYNHQPVYLCVFLLDFRFNRMCVRACMRFYAIHTVEWMRSMGK